MGPHPSTFPSSSYSPFSLPALSQPQHASFSSSSDPTSGPLHVRCPLAECCLHLDRSYHSGLHLMDGSQNGGRLPTSGDYFGWPQWAGSYQHPVSNRSPGFFSTSYNVQDSNPPPPPHQQRIIQPQLSTVPRWRNWLHFGAPAPVTLVTGGGCPCYSFSLYRLSTIWTRPTAGVPGSSRRHSGSSEQTTLPRCVRIAEAGTHTKEFHASDLLRKCSRETRRR